MKSLESELCFYEYIIGLKLFNSISYSRVQSEIKLRGKEQIISILEDLQSSVTEVTMSKPGFKLELSGFKDQYDVTNFKFYIESDLIPKTLDLENDLAVKEFIIDNVEIL